MTHKEWENGKELTVNNALAFGEVLENISNAHDKSHIDWKNHELFTDKEAYLQNKTTFN